MPAGYGELPPRSDDAFEYFEPAHPCNDNVDHDGLSIRDWFAGQVLNGMISNPDTHDLSDPRYFAKQSYLIADEMLKERVR